MSDISSTPSPSSSTSRPASPPPKTPPNLHQNSIDPSARWLVQKFGGTSIGKFAVKIAEDIVSFVASYLLQHQGFLNVLNSCRDYIDRHKVVIVCSARSGATKSLGTTSLLLQACSRPPRRNGSITPVTNRRDSLSHFPSFSSTPTSGQSSPGSKPRSPSLSKSLQFSALGLTTVSQERAQSFNGIVDLILSEHVTAARSTLQDPDILKGLEAELEDDCDALRSFLLATQVRFGHAMHWRSLLNAYIADH
jgi:aspartate kinase